MILTRFGLVGVSGPGSLVALLRSGFSLTRLQDSMGSSGSSQHSVSPWVWHAKHRKSPKFSEQLNKSRL